MALLAAILRHHPKSKWNCLIRFQSYLSSNARCWLYLWCCCSSHYCYYSIDQGGRLHYQLFGKHRLQRTKECYYSVHFSFICMVLFKNYQGKGLRANQDSNKYTHTHTHSRAHAHTHTLVYTVSVPQQEAVSSWLSLLFKLRELLSLGFAQSVKGGSEGNVVHTIMQRGEIYRSHRLHKTLYTNTPKPSRTCMWTHTRTRTNNHTRAHVYTRT